jgi:hypothetical protein
MMLSLVWGAPDLPEYTATTRGWTLMRKSRAVVSAIASATVLLLAIGLAPAASAADLQLRIVDPDGDGPLTGQPQDAKVGETIRTADLNVGGGFVQVEVIDTATGARVTNFNKPIGFELATGTGFASGDLDVDDQVPVQGVATFGPGTLSIGTENEPQFTNYALTPVTTRGPAVPGITSAGFDVWEDGNACDGGQPNGLPDACGATLRNNNEQYTVNAAGSLGASELFDVLPGLTCPGQKLIFDDRVFSYATTESDGSANTPVRLVSHITKADWKASANNGQAHADWCIGLPTNAPWVANGTQSQSVDVNGGAPGGILFVALAPKCPSANPSGSAPCIVSQTGDGKGGSIAIGWLPGGDPPRRT